MRGLHKSDVRCICTCARAHLLRMMVPPHPLVHRRSRRHTGLLVNAVWRGSRALPHTVWNAYSNVEFVKEVKRITSLIWFCCCYFCYQNWFTVVFIYAANLWAMKTISLGIIIVFGLNGSAWTSSGPLCPWLLKIRNVFCFLQCQFSPIYNRSSTRE